MVKRKVTPKKWTSARVGGLFGKIAIYFVLITVGFVYLQPIFEIIAKTFMSQADIIDPSVQWVPRGISFENLSIAAGVLKLEETLKNSILWSGAMAAAQTVVAALTGFALSRYTFKLKKFWFVMIVLAFIIPTPVLMIPRLMTLRLTNLLLTRRRISPIATQKTMNSRKQFLNTVLRRKKRSRRREEKR